MADAPRQPRRSPLSRLRFLGAALLLIVLMLRLTGCLESKFFYPSRDAFVTPPGHEDAAVRTPDGLTLHAWFVPARGLEPGRKAPAVLHLHGNAGNVEGHAAWSEYLPDKGISVLLLDYRGYGRSDPGAPSRQALLIDAAAALDHLLARPDVDPARVGVLGVSIGGVFAMELAATRPEVRSIATVSAFRSFPAVAGAHVPLLGHLLIRGGMAPESNAARLGARPLLVMHGRADEIVPPSHAQAIAAAAERAGTPVRLVWIDNATHNDTGLGRHEQQILSDFFRDTLAR